MRHTQHGLFLIDLMVILEMFCPSEMLLSDCQGDKPTSVQKSR